MRTRYLVPQAQGWILAITLVVLAPVTLAGCGGPIDPGPAVTIGSQLDGLSAKVVDAVEKSAAAARGVVTQAGSQVLQVIDRARLTFEASLDTAVDKVDLTVAGRLEQIQSLVNDFTNNAFEKATSVQSQAQQLVLTLPIANGQPQVRAWTPHFVTGQQPVTVVIDGIFTQAQRPGMEPHLQIGTATLTPSSGGNITQQLLFVVPAAAFGGSTANSVTPVSATLTVPFRSSILRQDKTAKFTLMFGLLPPSPGKIRMRRLVKSKVRKEEWRRSPTIKQRGGEERPVGSGSQTTPYCTDALDGDWRISPFQEGRELFHLTKSNGGPEHTAWSKEYTNVGSAHQQCVTVWTRSFSNGVWGTGVGGWGSGDIEFHLEWGIWRMEDVATWMEDRPVELQWGQRKEFEVALSQGWKITYEPFQGKQQEIAGPAQMDWLTVSKGATSVSVVTAAADNVRF